jgi:amino acid adenylation domain-containing protein
MTIISELLADLTRRSVELWFEGDTLRFRAPKGVLREDDRALLMGQKTAVLRQLKQRALDQIEIFPLAYSQRALWFIHQTAPASAAYHVAFSARICSEVDMGAFGLAVQALVDRHSSLRTTYAALDEGLVQQVHGYMECPLQVRQAKGADIGELKEIVVNAYREPFDLQKGPLLRAHIFVRGEKDYVMLLTAHHIACDGWSFLLLLDELRVLYAANKAQTAPALPRPKSAFVSYVEWQRQLTGSETGEKLFSYWQNKLSGELPVLNLPTDRPRPPTQTHNGSTHPFTIDADLTERLKSLAREQSSTLFTVLLAAFHVMLHRYTGQEDILVGTPTYGRNRAEFSNLVGDLINTVALRGDLSGNPTFTNFLAQMRHVAMEALEHQDYPFPLLVERLRLARDLSRSPIYQSMFILQKFGLASDLEKFLTSSNASRMDFGGIELEPFFIPQQEGQLELVLEMGESGNQLFGNLKYNTDLFDAETIERMAGHFETLLTGVVADPAQRVSELELLPEAERHKLLVEWNATEAAYPADKTLVQLFEEQVERSPEAVAVEYEGNRLTYRELNDRANQLAHYLMTLGIGPDVMAGLYMERSLEMVIGIYGIIKAGGAYVPLDPEYPTDRIAFMVTDTDVSVLLTQERLVAGLPQQRAIVISLDSDWNLMAGESTENPHRGAAPENLAYVIYTSGSTGRPKGVMNEHRGIVNRLLWMQEEYNLTSADRVLQKTPFSFDVSVWEFFWPLQVGACLVLSNPGGHRDSSYLTQIIIDQKITTLHFVPSMLRIFLEEDDVERCTSIKRVICSGEALPFDLQKHFFEKLDKELHNLYGPTEAAVDVTYWACRPDSDHNIVPIGYPVANTQLYILDPNLSPVPIGCAGELHIGGIQVARGYLNRPELTAEKFIPDPFSAAPNARLYKTGDLARHLPDGSIEYLGRIDFQVKIRGLRVELGEIEVRLAELEAVNKCVVIVREDRPRDQRLVAYYVAEPGLDVSNSDWRSYLRLKLPEYMIPQHFVELKSIPLSPNGKVDRKALPKPETDGASEQGYVAPRTETEQKIAAVWQEVLNREKVGVYDDFFKLGGHSLLATQIITRIRAVFQVNVPIKRLFELPTIASLALEIDCARKTGEAISLPKIAPSLNLTEFPLSYAQERMWFIEQLSPDSPVNNIPLAVALSGCLDRKMLSDSIKAVIQRHATLRTTIVSSPEGPRQRVNQAVTFDLPIISLAGDSTSEASYEQEIRSIILKESSKPFSLEKGPLFRFLLIERSTTEHILLICLHHMISDGWSIGVLFKEISCFYRAAAEGTAASLPMLAIQYGDFSEWQKRIVNDGKLKPQIDFWQTRLVDDLPHVHLPADRIASQNQSFAGKMIQFSLSPIHSEALRNLCRKENATAFMGLLTAFKIFLLRYTGCEDIVVGSPIANRNHAETENLIGLFMNPLPFRTDFSGDPTYIQALARVRDTAFSAYQNQDVPFNTLVQTIRPNRRLGYLPFYQTMFIYQTLENSNLALPAIESRLILELDRSTTMGMDIILQAWESGEQFHGIFEYRTDLFTEKAAKRMLSDMIALLAGALENPDCSIAALPLSSGYDMPKLGNGREPRADLQLKECIHEIIANRAAMTPDRVAVAYGRDTITYGELNRRANQLARYIVKAGAKPEAIIGISMERSIDLIVAVLAVLKSGAAYMPLDPMYPEDRLSYMANDAMIRILLTDAESDPSWCSGATLIIRPSGERERIEEESPQNLVVDYNQNHLAYVIFTSGSTGRAKGVMVEHRSLSNAFYAWDEAYDLNAIKTHLQMANFSFDVFTGDFTRALCSGGKLVLCPREILLAPEELCQLIGNEVVDCAEFVPSVLRTLVGYLKKHQLRLETLKVLICGSESWFMDEYGSFLKICGPNTRLINSFGVTEATIDTTWFESKQPDYPARHLVPIGKPFRNMQAYILNSKLQPVPVGVSGELFIGGEGLARGYLNQPELTAQRFIRNSFRGRSPIRLYHTGDFARYLSDGNIELLGRMDYQVKIRGNRVEPGEVEAWIKQYPNVKDTAVIAWGAPQGGNELAAYLVLEKSDPIDVSGLRQFLKRRLPDYMIPTSFNRLEKMPLTPAGKIDRRALPRPEKGRLTEDIDFLLPRNSVEHGLAEIWKEVLGVDRVGIKDDFFDLGGHSLLATQVHSRIQERFAIRMDLRSLFDATTVTELAQLIDTLKWMTDTSIKSKATAAGSLREQFEL